MSFRSARIEAGKKVADVMEYLGVSDGAVYQWETGISLPSADKLQKLSVFYGCSMETIMDGNPKREQTRD